MKLYLCEYLEGPRQGEKVWMSRSALYRFGAIVQPLGEADPQPAKTTIVPIKNAGEKGAA